MEVLTFILFTFLSVVADSQIQEKSAQKRLPIIPKTTLTNTTDVSEAAEDNFEAAESTTTDGTTTELLISTASTCESNYGECENVNVTTIRPVKNDTVTNKTANEKNNKKKKSKVETVKNICTCNLQVSFCDINCCCDSDCSPNDKKIFGYCEMDENLFYDSRYCNYLMYIYVNNTPFKWEVNQDGLFCVINSNLPDTYLIQKESPIDSIETIKVEKKFWSEEIDDFLEVESQFGSKNYRFGDSIMIVRDDSSIDNFRLPRNFLTSPCIFEEDVYYLKDVKNTCSQITMADDNWKLNFSSFFKKFKIIGSPMSLNITKLNHNIYKTCPKNICIDIEPKLCDVHFTNCVDVQDDATIEFHCSYDLKKNLNTCRHAVEKIHYKFYHNGISGLRKVEVLGVLKNYHFGREDFQFFQHFSAEFMWINQVKNYSQILSGNPGYISGKSILVGTQIINGSSIFIRRNSSRFLENFLVFPVNVAGECLRNDTYNTPIDFEYNMIAKCLLHRKLQVENHQNASDICQSIQESIFDLWDVIRENNESLVVGLLGNANASNLQDWTSILYRTKPKDFLNFTRGNFSKENATLLCQNISTFFNVVVLYSRVDFKTILNQHKILGVSFSFENVRSHSFRLNKKNASFNNSSSLEVSLELVNRVSFYDVTSEKTKKFVDSPSLNIRLPYDFFYPFIRVDNGLRSVTPNIFVIVLFLYWNHLF